MTSAEKVGDGVRAVERALDILLAFSASDRGLTATELLKRVDLSRPTLYRLLHTLESRGFVFSEGDPQRFRLGEAVAHLTYVWSASLEIANVAQPMMRRLWEQTGETVSLLLHQGLNRVCIAELPSSQPLSFKRGVGYSEKVVLGASGRAILAYVPDALRYLEGSGLIDAPQIYLDELQRIKSAGYAISRDELIQGAVAVAVPFFSGNGHVLGSLAVFGPKVRLDDQRIEVFVECLIREANLLSQALGH